MDTPTLDDHSRTIIHLDLDCFYAQVEMVKNPWLKELPVGIQQKNIVVTSNYVAREYGIKKCMLITEAKKLCPNLVLVNGEDLHSYRRTSYEVTKLIQSFCELVERLGLDENFVDVTGLVNQKLQKCSDLNVIGNMFGDITELCDCGCTERLKIGTLIAKEIREKIYSELGLTTCAGVACNKLLAKLVGAKYKPNQQTVVFPNSALQLMLSLNSVKNIPGIGVALAEQLQSIGVQTISELQNVEFSQLRSLLGSEKARNVQNFSFGIDAASIKVSGKPQSIGIEDSCKALSAESEIINKLRQLLHRLLILVGEDGRVPKTIKITIRKFDKNTKINSRETRQCSISPGLFNPKNLSQLSESSENKIMNVIMILFKKVVDTKKPYSLTLLGLSFTKFIEMPSTKTSLTKFLKKDIEVQSLTKIENKSTEYLNNNNVSPSVSTISSESHNAEQPSLKKGKFNLFTKRPYIHLPDVCDSPSKLKVEELHLGSHKNLVDTTLKEIFCPPNAREEVFRELPRDLQLELWEEYKTNRERDKKTVALKKPKTKTNSILNYLVKNA